MHVLGYDVYFQGIAMADVDYIDHIVISGHDEFRINTDHLLMLYHVLKGPHGVGMDFKISFNTSITTAHELYSQASIPVEVSIRYPHVIVYSEGNVLKFKYDEFRDLIEAIVKELYRYLKNVNKYNVDLDKEFKEIL